MMHKYFIFAQNYEKNLKPIYHGIRIYLGG